MLPYLCLSNYVPYSGYAPCLCSRTIHEVRSSEEWILLGSFMELVPTGNRRGIKQWPNHHQPHNLWYMRRGKWKRELSDFCCLGWLSTTLCLLSLSKKFSRCPDPVNAHLRPDCHFGSIPEKLSQQVASFVAKNPQDSLATEEEEWARKRIWEQLFRLACSDCVLVCTPGCSHTV